VVFPRRRRSETGRTGGFDSVTPAYGCRVGRIDECLKELGLTLNVPVIVDAIAAA
jgi:hypothetical protein